MRLWNASTGAFFALLETDVDPLDLVFSPSSELLAVIYEDGFVGIWVTSTSTQVQTIECCGSDIRAIAFSPDEEVLVSAVDGMVQFWSVKSGDFQRAMNIPEGYSSHFDVAFSPDLRLIALAPGATKALLLDLAV